jgi:lantibiotic modifying enzyme
MENFNRIINRSLHILSSEEDIYFSGLYEGLSGMLLYLGYLKKYHNSKTAHSLFDTYYRRNLEVISQTDQLANLSNGLAGISWVLRQLEKMDVVAEPEDLSEINNLIAKGLPHDFDSNNYDLFLGFTGKLIGLAALTDSYWSPQVEQAIETLGKNAIKSTEGIFWPDMDKPGHINLGLAHGAPGIVSFLCDCAKMPRQNDPTELICEALNWLISAEIKGQIYSFPNEILIGGGENQKYRSRLSWCFGDLGVAFALLKGSVVTGNNTFFKKGLEIANKTLSRGVETAWLSKVGETEFLNLGLCHGIPSIAILYKKIYLLTGEEKFCKAYDFWLSFALKELTHQLNNFNSVPLNIQRFENITYKKKYGVLEGVTGALMVLLSEKYKNITEWEELFLLRS